jgi:hypothetical protein
VRNLTMLYKVSDANELAAIVFRKGTTEARRAASATMKSVIAAQL